MKRKPGPLAMFVLLLTSLVQNAQAADSGQPHFEELPPTCSYLTETLAQSILQAPARPSAANEHIPTFVSQCMYAGQGVVRREVQYTFKFQLLDMFDTAVLDREQLLFNATMAAGGAAPLEMLDDPGRVAFTYDSGDQSMLLVVTGIQGPVDGAGRPTGFLASYRLSHPELSREERLQFLLAEARKQLDEWLAGS